MKWIGYIVYFVASIASISPLLGADWKSLNERADETTYTEAIQRLQGRTPAQDDLYIAGLAALKESHIDEACVFFQEIAHNDATWAGAQWGTAECLRRKRQYDRSIAVLQDIIKKDPAFAPAYISLAYIRYTQTDFLEASHLAYQVIRLGEGSVDSSTIVQAYALYAGAKGMLAHFGGPITKIVHGRAVLPYLKKAESLQPASASVLFGLGSYFLLVPKVFGRNIDQAERYLLAARDTDPFFVDTYVRLAQVYKIKGDDQRYHEYLDKALAIEPEHEIALDVKNGRCSFICPE